MQSDEQLNELIIEEVKKYEFLYNNAHSDHGKRLPTQKTWEKISSFVGDTVQKCKYVWFGLRKRFVHEYIKMTSDKTQKGYKSNWKYFDAMAFLKGYVDSNQNFLERLMKMSKRDTFCRTCMSPLKTSDELSSLSYNIFNSDNLDVKLLLCTSLKCVPWDDYPHSLCEVCYRKVLDFHNFQCMCRTSLEKFNDMLQNQIELKSDTDADEDCEESRLNFMAEYADISSHSLEEKISIHSEEIQSTTEQQYNSCVDPLSDQTNDDFVNADNKKSKKCLKLEEDVKECTTFKEISKKQRTRKRKPTVNDDIAEESENRKFHSDIVSRKRKSKTKIHGTPIEDTEIEDDKDFENEDVPADFPDDTSISDFSESSDYVKEININKVALKCDTCSQTFRFQHRLEAHQRRHQGLQGYPCTFENCKRAYNRLDDLRNHLNDHNGIPNVYKCNIDNCNMVYKCFSGLNKHKRKLHKCGKELKKYPCETCGKVLTNPRSLTGHRYIHMDKSQWPYVCDEKDCTRRFRLMSQLSIHKKRHAGIKNYVCPHCGVRKTTCTELKIHINFHTFEQKYPCNFCSKVFKSVGMMRTHINRVHEGKKPANDTVFACSFCDRKFSSLQSKKFHEMTHTGEKRYACEECGKTFTYPSGLASHKNMHLKGENPYACNECGRRFKWPSALKSHVKLHSDGSKPYSCEECGKGFRWPGSYYKHKKTHLRSEVANHEEEVGVGKEEHVVQTEESIPISPGPSNYKYEVAYVQYTTIDLDTNKVV